MLNFSRKGSGDTRGKDGIGHDGVGVYSLER